VPKAKMRAAELSMRTFSPSESQGWTIHFIERVTRYWVDAQAGQKTNQLFEKGTAQAWQWASAARFIRGILLSPPQDGRTIDYERVSLHHLLENQCRRNKIFDR
jgi:hypothetical protein